MQQIATHLSRPNVPPHSPEPLSIPFDSSSFFQFPAMSIPHVSPLVLWAFPNNPTPLFLESSPPSIDVVLRYHRFPYFRNSMSLPIDLPNHQYLYPLSPQHIPLQPPLSIILQLLL